MKTLPGGVTPADRSSSRDTLPVQQKPSRHWAPHRGQETDLPAGGQDPGETARHFCIFFSVLMFNKAYYSHGEGGTGDEEPLMEWQAGEPE